MMDLHLSCYTDRNKPGYWRRPGLLRTNRSTGRVKIPCQEMRSGKLRDRRKDDFSLSGDCQGI
ncbi:hypothetical protein ACFL5H_01350 [Candidatus Latescibacterota bacterium]